MSENFKQRLSKIKAFVFDIDGVMTDGKIYLNSDNTTGRMLNAKDGYAISQAVKNGFTVAIISFAKEENLKTRLLGLGIHEVYLGSYHKEETLKEFAAVYGIEFDEMLYMGDDLPDMLAMKRCGIASCPYDAAHEIREISQYVSPFKGGEGCVRDVIEQVLRLNGKW